MPAHSSRRKAPIHGLASSSKASPLESVPQLNFTMCGRKSAIAATIQGLASMVPPPVMAVLLTLLRQLYSIILKNFLSLETREWHLFHATPYCCDDRSPNVKEPSFGITTRRRVVKGLLNCLCRHSFASSFALYGALFKEQSVPRYTRTET